MKTAVMSLHVDEEGNVDVRFQGDDSLKLPMLGSLDLGKSWLLRELNKGRTDHKGNLDGEKTIGKNEAINFYLEKRKEIESRLEAISKSDDRAVFKIKK